MTEKYFVINEYTIDMWRERLQKAMIDLISDSPAHERVSSIDHQLGLIVNNQKPIPLEHTGEFFSKGEIVVSLGIDWIIDYAIPKGWQDDVIDSTGIDPAPHFVWSYKDRHGVPLPITEKGKTILEMYNYVITKRSE